MPNHVRNILKFSKLKPEDKEFIINKFTSEVKGVYPLNRVFDFDKVIAEPRKKEECDPDCLKNKDSFVVGDSDRPWFDWYAWRTKYWGTKWNAYDGYIMVGINTITFVFNTAWSTPQPIYEQLARFFTFNFTVRYADELNYDDCGTFQFVPEDDILRHYNIKSKSATAQKAFWRRVWNY